MSQSGHRPAARADSGSCWNRHESSDRVSSSGRRKARKPNRHLRVWRRLWQVRVLLRARRSCGPFQRPGSWSHPGSHPFRGLPHPWIGTPNIQLAPDVSRNPMTPRAFTPIRRLRESAVCLPPLFRQHLAFQARFAWETGCSPAAVGWRGRVRTGAGFEASTGRRGAQPSAEH